MRQKGMTPVHVMVALRLRSPRAAQEAHQPRDGEARLLTPLIS